MTVATLALAPNFELGALAIRSLAVPSRGSKELSVWRADLPPSGRSGEHSLDREQVIVVNEGTITAYIGGELFLAGEGDALILPVDTVIEMVNEADVPAEAVVISVVGFAATAGGQTFTPPWAL